VIRTRAEAVAVRVLNTVTDLRRENAPRETILHNLANLLHDELMDAVWSARLETSNDTQD
jgi:hypothetical protein